MSAAKVDYKVRGIFPVHNGVKTFFGVGWRNCRKTD